MAASTSSSSAEEQERYRKSLYAYALGQLKKEKRIKRERIATMNPTELENHINEMENRRRRATKPATLYEYQETIQSSNQPMQHKPWEPKNIEPDLQKECELLKKMLNTIVELATSDFYSKLVQQIQTPHFLNHFSRVLGSEPMFRVVIYGEFVHFSTHESAQRKLALMLLLKRDFSDRIGEIQIFDSYFNTRDIRVLEDLGFSVLRVDDNSYREALKPTLFFLPNATNEQYDGVLRANWKPENLNRMIILGGHLNGIKINAVCLNQLRLDVRQFHGHLVRMCRYLMCIHIFTTEVAMSSIDGDEFSKDFKDLSWQFFTWFEDDPKMKLQLKQVVIFAGVFYYLFYKYCACKRIYDQFYQGEKYSWKRNYSNCFSLGWLFRRHRIRSDKRRSLEKKKKMKMLFYLSRTILVPWFEGLPRKEWTRARKISKGMMNWLKRNDAKMSVQQLDELIEDWF